MEREGVRGKVTVISFVVVVITNHHLLTIVIMNLMMMVMMMVTTMTVMMKHGGVRARAGIIVETVRVACVSNRSERFPAPFHRGGAGV